MAFPLDRNERTGAHPVEFAPPSGGSSAAFGPAPHAAARLPVVPARRAGLVRQGRHVWPWAWAVLGLFGLATVSYFFSAYGIAASVIAGLIALVPFAGVVFFLVWLDRWEPEPRGMMLFAVMWGSFVSVMLTIWLSSLIARAFPDIAWWFGPVVRAPLVEEVLKCAGLLLLMAMGKRVFDGATDGIVYGGLIGAGFAFCENIVYFVEAAMEGGVTQLSATFFLRGVMSPFAHIMFTAACGFAVGLAIRRGKNPLPAWGIGLVVAIVLHALWNATAALTTFFPLYVLMQMPIFAAFVIGAIRFRNQELRIRRVALDDYVDAGWFAPEEADMLSTRAGRRVALRWAASLPGDRRPIMRRFIHDGASLAWARYRARRGRDPQAVHDERVLLDRMMRLRADLLAP